MITRERYRERTREKERERLKESDQLNKFEDQLDKFDQNFHASSKCFCLYFLVQDINPFRQILLF